MSLVMKIHSKEEGSTEVLRFYAFEKAADTIRVSLIPEIANAINDAVSDGGRNLKKRVHELTNILAKICSVSDANVAEGVREWEAIVLDKSLGYGYIELIL